MARHELAPDTPLRGGMLLPRDEALPPVPLEQTAITVEVAGPLAETVVAQRFHNTHRAPLDALYIFPLPLDAAVSELTLRIGERMMCGEIHARAEAQTMYEEAAARGAGAAIVNQQRPNLFSVDVANLQPGEIVEVRLRFFSQVPFDDGWFTLAIPTVVLPRYVPADEPATPRDGVVPLLPEGVAGHTLSLQVTLHLGLLAEVACVGLELDIQTERGRSVATLRDPAAVPDRDVVLRYRPAGADYAAAAFAYREAGRPGAALLMLTPRAVPALDAVLPRELLFVFDRSGSMDGESIAQARNALRACLRALNPGDSFNIFPFDDHVEQLAPAPLAFNQQSVDAADAFIAAIEARGGTEIVPALSAALDQPRDPQRLRVIVFLTDGAVGNEDAVLRALASRLNEARVFAFGVGSAVNRFLLDRLAAVGRGIAEYILPGEPIEPAVQRFQQRASLPLVRDLAVAWGGAAVADVLPDPLPDLYAGQPLVLLARYTGSRDQQATVIISGRTARGSFSERLEVSLPIATPDRHGAWAALPKLWARARIVALEDTARLDRGRAAALEAEAKALALEHGLLSAYTAFVAVEEVSPEGQGQRAKARVLVPVHLPAGTQRDAFETDLFAPSGVRFATGPAPRAASRSRTAAPKSVPGMAKMSFKSGLEDTMAALFGSPSPVTESAAPHRADVPSAERSAAALRFLARTQNVSGAWADDELATVLSVLAFARAGHTAHAGGFRAQLSRSVAWLKARPARGPGVELALHALAGASRDLDAVGALAHEAIRAAKLDLWGLAQAQRLGGDADGAVLLATASHLRPSAEVLRLTAALAILSV
ncbi:MAG: VIT domain-containing protein [Chloroflexales bacterium]